MLKLYAAGIGLLLLSGCASYGVFDNTVLTTELESAQPYSMRGNHGRRNTEDIGLVLAFSGGGREPLRWPTGCWKSCATPQ